MNRPFKTPSIAVGPLGDVGDEVPPPQAEASVASVAQDAIWQASVQNRRRETDLFVSLHVNYVAGTSSNAIETYYFGQYQDIRSRALAQRENRYSSYAISEFQELLKGMQNSVKLDESKRLATAIQRRLLENVRQHDPAVLDTGVKTAPFAVLRLGSKLSKHFTLPSTN